MKVRYAQISEDMTDAIRTTKPLFFGKDAELQEAALLTSIAMFESGFRKDVDDGKVRGDSGGSWCLMQINIGGGHIPTGIGDAEVQSWTGKDLIKDRKKCFIAAIEYLRYSMKACNNYKGSDVISGYTIGTCATNEPKAKSRWSYAGSLVNKNPYPVPSPIVVEQK